MVGNDRLDVSASLRNNDREGNVKPKSNLLRPCAHAAYSSLHDRGRLRSLYRGNFLKEDRRTEAFISDDMVTEMLVSFFSPGKDQRGGLGLGGHAARSVWTKNRSYHSGSKSQLASVANSEFFLVSGEVS